MSPAARASPHEPQALKAAGVSPANSMSATCPPPQQQLPPVLQLHILSFLPPNDRALSGRLVSPDAAVALTGPDNCTASLSQPLPPHTVAWAVEATQQRLRQLPFRHKLQLLCTATASGSEVNLEMLLPLLRPSIFSEVWYTGGGMTARTWSNDPGVAAVGAGHPQLLGMLLDRCPGLLDPDKVLAAAAKHCDLAGLQAAWGLLRCYPMSTRLIRGWRTATPGNLAHAAESVTSDVVAKMEWVLNNGDLGPRAAAAAVRLGDLSRLRARGCPMGGYGVLQSSLERTGLAVAQWLVDEAGCSLPVASRHQEWHVLRIAAASARDAVAKLQWLGERGVPPLLEAGDDELAGLVRVAVAAGRVYVVQHLRSLPGLTPQQDQRLLQVACTSGRAVLSTPMVEYLLRAGMELMTSAAYYQAAGNLETVRWLARKGSCRPSTDDLINLIVVWPCDAPSHSRDLLQAVQLLVGQVGCTDWGVQQRPKEGVVWAAARKGELALVQYLLQQLPGYQPGGKILVDAAEGGCGVLLGWLVEQHPGRLAGPWVQSAFIVPAVTGQRGTLAALQRLGVPWGAEDVVVRAVAWGCPVPALRWLVEQGAPVGRAGAMEAAMAWSRHPLSAEEGAWLRGLAATNRVS